jgi:dTDP-4-amino-4,6-dideoxygalactose transaminase
LEQLPGFLDAKRRLFQRYQAAFAGIEGAGIVPEPEGCQSNYWLQTLLLAPAKADQQEAILAASNDTGLMTRPAWTLMNRLRPYRDCPAMDLTCAVSLATRLINVPSSTNLVDLRA